MGLVMMRTHCRVTRAHVLFAARLRPRPAETPEPPDDQRSTRVVEPCFHRSAGSTSIDPTPHRIQCDCNSRCCPINSRLCKIPGLSMLTGSVLLRASSFNRLALFAAAVTSVSPRRRSSCTTGSTMELGDDYRTFSSFDTSTNHHHALRCFLPIFTGG